jgi:hypothetical protein
MPNWNADVLVGSSAAEKSKIARTASGPVCNNIPNRRKWNKWNKWNTNAFLANGPKARFMLHL